jgi:CheY-like chemotaxis protein
VSSPRTILVVDDDPVTLSVTQAVLEDAGFKVATRETPVGTGAHIQKSRPDLVLLDVNMPALTGDRLAELLTKNGRMAGARLVFYSSSSETDLRRLAAQYGAAGWIRKGTDHGELVNEVQRLLGAVSLASG